MDKFIFDVDGTLTKSRHTIDPDFQSFMVHFASRNDCFLVTGSDRPKTIEQIGYHLYNKMGLVFQCSGNDVWYQNERLKTIDLVLPQEMFDRMDYWLEKSEFPVRTGEHVDMRPGLCNFSVIGRGCAIDEREEYKQWDVDTNERNIIAEDLRKRFGASFDIQVAGETGLDITRKGYDKSQIVHYFSPYDKLYFFGDQMDEGGNDYTLMKEITLSGSEAHHVKSWEETWSILRSLSSG